MKTHLTEPLLVKRANADAADDGTFHGEVLWEFGSVRHVAGGGFDFAATAQQSMVLVKDVPRDIARAHSRKTRCKYLLEVTQRNPVLLLLVIV